MTEIFIVDEWWYPLDIDDRLKDIYEINTSGTVRNKYTGKIVKPYTDKDGYLRYTLQGKDKKIKFYAHRLVAMKFINGDFQLQVNHKDARKDNNYYENLEWVTNRENIQHSLENKLQEFVKGSKHGGSLITEKEADILCKYISQGFSNIEILNKIPGYFNLTRLQLRSILKHIRHKKSWCHVSDLYF